jgi:esterase
MMAASHVARLSVTSLQGAAPTTRHLVMLHGIFGRGRNWQPIARRVVDARPDYTCWLVDLRHHGDSEKAGAPDTLAGLASDVVHWMSEAAIEATATLGHSYGGKVALAIAAQRRDVSLQTWVIDSTPEVKTPGGSAWEMLRVVRSLPDHFSTRAEAVEGIVAGGFSTGVAQWMSTNLARTDDGFQWSLDFDVMERLLRDFFATDLWEVLERPAPGHDIHVLKATASSVITPEAVSRLEALSDGGAPVHLHQLEGGHWIHAESPDAVAALLTAHLPG